MEEELRVTDTEELAMLTVGDVYPIMITLNKKPQASYVALKWDEDKRVLQIECKNATVEEGAQQFFEFLRDNFGEWILSKIIDSPDACQYCGK